MSDLLIVVPARGGSKRLPQKNLCALGGRSLLAHTAEAIAVAGLGAPVLLSTDDDAIAAEGRRLGWRVPFRRPAELSTDASATVSVVLHALDWYRDENGSDPAAVMILQPTSPFRGAGCLRAAVSALARRADIDSVIAMTALHLPPARLFAVGTDGVAHPLGVEDGRKPVYAPNGALYLVRTSALRRAGTVYAGAILPLVLEGARAIDIDTAGDWRLAEAALAAGLPAESGTFDPAPSIAAPVA
jgi:CMP-N,N'-diacetyllegionaminic acid synthase